MNFNCSVVNGFSLTMTVDVSVVFATGYLDAIADEAEHPAMVNTTAISNVANFLIGDLPFLIFEVS